MINFFGLKDILAKESLWANKKEHSALIKKMEMTKSYNLPNRILEEIFPFGWKSPEAIDRKKSICDKVLNKYPILFPPSKPMKELSEKELRSFIEELDKSFEGQFDECIKIIYKLDSDDKTFLETKEYVYNKLKKSFKQQVTIIFLSLSCFAFALIPQIFALITGTEISDTYLKCGVALLLLIFIIESILAFSRKRYFRLNNGNYPSLD